MKPFCIIIFITTLCNACSTKPASEQNQNANTASLIQFSWMLGNWENTTADGIFTETWLKTNDTVFTGKGLIVAANDTVFEEDIKLHYDNGNIYYTVTTTGQNNQQPVSFKYIDTIPASYVFENKEHDFPTRIIYQKITADSIVALIEGTVNGKTMKEEFPMRKVDH